MKNGKEINDEFKKLAKEWLNIYQWKLCTSKGYTETISEILLNNFHTIKWSSIGLRKSNFKIEEHKGQCLLSTDISQFTEKRFCRALYNENTLPYFGKIIDYEIPLTEPKQGKNKKSQGDIDLISKNENKLFLIEVKAVSNGSLLKAILEIFVYTFRLYEYKIINTLKIEFDIEGTSIIPAVLVYKNSTSGQQITFINDFPKLKELINRINIELNKYEVGKIEFYIFDDFNLSKSLKVLPLNQKESLIKLKQPIQIVQFHINIEPVAFVTMLDNLEDIKKIESYLNSFLNFYKFDAVNYIIKRINDFQDKVDEYNKTYPKGEVIFNNASNLVKKESPFIDAYLNVLNQNNQYNYPELLDLNLRLMNPYRNNKLVPLVSFFKETKVLDKLIEAYNNIPIIRVKDLDGILEKELDLQQESIISSAICKYDDKKIISVLMESLLKGKYLKELVINKLLKYISKDELLGYVSKYSDTDILFSSISDNAKWVIKYLNEDNDS